MIVNDRELLNKIVLSILLPIAKDSMYSLKLLLSGELYSTWLRNYLIWKLLPQYLSDFTEEQRYLNMYYWLKGFYRIFQLQHNTDAGIEQQISLLFEEISNNLSDFDWKKLELVDEEITIALGKIYPDEKL